MIARPTSRRWLLGAFAVVTLLGTACAGGDDPSSGQATVPKATTSTSTADPWAVPDPIDAAYVERVLAELDRIDGDAARLIVTAGELTPPAVARMRAIYGTDELNFQLEVWGELVAKKFAGVKIPPGQRRTVVVNVLAADASCVFAETRSDFSETASSAPPPSVAFVTLKRVDESHDEGHLNLTLWRIEATRVPQGDHTPVNRCVG